MAEERVGEGCFYCNMAGGYEDHDGSWQPCPGCYSPNFNDEGETR